MSRPCITDMVAALNAAASAATAYEAEILSPIEDRAFTIWFVDQQIKGKAYRDTMAALAKLVRAGGAK